MAARDPENLNYQFHYNEQIAKLLLPSLPRVEDRMNVNKWVMKLATCNHSKDEAQLRNDFMYFLVKNMQTKNLQPPFNNAPPSGPLLTHAELLSGMSGHADESIGWFNEEAENSRTTAGDNRNATLFNLSPDNGDFLISQPLPRCGVFCYMAVVSKAPDENETD